MTTASSDSRRAEPTASLEALAGKYLTFRLGDCEYALPVRKVREIVKIAPITPVPHVPSWIRGVINLRGKVIAIVELRLKFGLPPIEYTDRTCIIVLETMQRDGIAPMGIIVDAVSDVIAIGPEQLEHPPSLASAQRSTSVEGLAKIRDSVKILLNVDELCRTDVETGAALAPVA